MDEKALVELLGTLEPPEVDNSTEAATVAVTDRVRATRSAEPRNAVRRTPRMAAAASMLLAVVVAFALFTPPGQALTSWVGRRIGLGEPGGQPRLQILRRNIARTTQGTDEPAYVLLRGPGPSGGVYEFVTYRMRGGGESCFQLQFSASRALMAEGCGIPSGDHKLYFEGTGENSGQGFSYRFASGRVSADIASVEVFADGRRVPVELREIPSWLIRRLHIERPFGYFLAYLDPTTPSGTVSVTAKDASGRIVAHKTIGGEGLPSLSETLRREACVEVRTLAKAGKVGRAKVRKACQG